MVSESEEMDCQAGSIMQRTINEFYDGNPVAYAKALWEWIDTVPEVWEPLPKFKLTEGYMIARNSVNPRGLSYEKSKEAFPDSLTLVSQFYAYKQVSHNLPHSTVPKMVELLDMSNSKKFWGIVRKEERSDEPLEAKLARFAEKRPPKDQGLPEEASAKTLKQMITDLAYKYLFETTLRKLYIEYNMKGLTERLEFLMDK